MQGHLSRLALQSPGMTEGPHWNLKGERGRALVELPDPAETAYLGVFTRRPFGPAPSLAEHAWPVTPDL